MYHPSINIIKNNLSKNYTASPAKRSDNKIYNVNHSSNLKTYLSSNIKNKSHDNQDRKYTNQITYDEFIQAVGNEKQLEPQQLRKIYNQKRNHKLKSVYLNPPIPMIKQLNKNNHYKDKQLIIPAITANLKNGQQSIEILQKKNQSANSIADLLASKQKFDHMQRIKEIYSSRKKQYINNIKRKYQDKSVKSQRDYIQTKIMNYANSTSPKLPSKLSLNQQFVRISSKDNFIQKSFNKNNHLSEIPRIQSSQKSNINFNKIYQSDNTKLLVKQNKLIESQQISTNKQLKPQQKIFQRINVQNILQRKYQKDFQKFMQGYKRKLKISENSKIFIFDSQDIWIKKILESRGWYQNDNKESNAFNFKWTTKVDKKVDYHKSQLINHFKDSDKLTSKSGLIKALKENQKLKSFIPRSYELSSQYIEFIKDYQETSLSCLLKKKALYIKKFLNKNKIQLQIFQDNKIYPQFSYMINQKNVFYSEQNSSLNSLILHIPFTLLICSYFICKMNKMQNLSDWNQQFLLLNETSYNKLQSFSKIKPPYDQFYESQTPSRKNKLFLQKNQQQKLTQDRLYEEKSTKLLIKFGKTINQYSISQAFNIPSLKLLNIVLSLDSYFMKKSINYLSDGVNNYWIKKPSTSSKGVGIRLQSNQQSLLKVKQNYIIQKYIQQCMIIEDFSIIHRKKFDLRIWVLVKSFDPLIAFYYQDFYAKIAPQQYDLQNFQNHKKHLTNYSQHKQSFKNKEDSVISGKYLIQKLTKIYSGEKDKFQKIMQDKIQQILINTLLVYQKKIQNYENSFQLYGFDILIDKVFNFHLLQVNLSPACNQRVQWLSKMLQQMSQSLLDMLIGQKQTFTKDQNQTKHNNLIKSKGRWKSLFQQSKY